MNELFLKIPQEKRERIIQAAVLEFSTRGYDNANTNKIAKNAHISVGSLFQYFESKEALFLMVVEHCFQALTNVFKNVVKEDDSFFVTIEKILRIIIKESRENPNIINLYMEISSPSTSNIVRQTAGKLEGYSYKLYCSLISKGQREGIVRKDCDMRIFPFLLDNLLIMLQYSLSRSYYQERFRIFCGDNILNQDELIVKETMKFIKSAFSS